MRTLPLLLLALAAAAPLAAQQPDEAPRLEVGVDLSHWRLNNGFEGASTLRSGTLRAAVLLPGRAPSTVGLSATYVPQSGAAPEMLGFAGEFAQRVAPRRPDQLNLFVGAGAGLMRLATEGYYGIASCPVAAGCLDGGAPEMRTAGWRWTLSGSAGVDVPLVRGSLLQPAVQVVRTFGTERQGSSPGWMARVGVGLAWRS